MPVSPQDADESNGAARAVAYLADVENGTTVDPEHYSRDLSEADKSEFRELIDFAGWAKHQMPVAPTTPRMLTERYELVERLGAGGFGQVWRGRDRRLDRDVAIKVLHLAATTIRSARESFEKEKQALARLEHPSVVRIHDAGTADGLFFLVTELVRGRSLDAVVDSVREAAKGHAPDVEQLTTVLPAKRLATDYAHAVAAIGVRLLQALEAVHAAGLLHRDIKPANVMLTLDGEIKLLDFGLAGLKDPFSGATAGFAGTPNYWAPEQLRDERTGRDARTDVYQTGLVLYELLCFRPAFPRALANLFTAIKEGRCPRPRRIAPWVPVDLEDICLLAMEPDVERRYGSAAAFRADLERWLGGHIPLAARGGSLGKAQRISRAFVRRNRVPVAIGASVLAGAIAATAWLPWRSPSAKVVSFDPTTGSATVELSTAATVVFTLKAFPGDAPPGAKLSHARMVPVAFGDQAPEWAVVLSPSRADVRIMTPAGFWSTQGNSYRFELQAMAFPPGELASYRETWAALGESIRNDADEPGLTPSMVEAALTGTGRGGGKPAIDFATLMRHLEEEG